MLGLMYLGAASLYLALMFFVVRGAWRQGRAGGSVLKACVFSALAFLAVYMPVFWNWIPTKVAHSKMCAKDAGFKMIVPADQWYAANKVEVDRINKLPRNIREKTSNAYEAPDGYRRRTYFDGLLASEFKSERLDLGVAKVYRTESRKVDAHSGAVLATVVDYQTGSREDVRLWLSNPSCFVDPPAEIGRPPKVITPRDQFTVYGRALIGENK